MEKQATVRLDFFKQFLKNPTKIGAITPSSSELAKAMVQDIKIGPGETILELGPGTGAFTRHIQQILPDKQAYVGIELEPKFVQHLQSRFPDLCFIVGRAENANELYQRSGFDPAKAIISGIPFAVLNEKTRRGILQTLQRLMPPGCIFRTFQYVHAYRLPPAVKFRRQMDEIFGNHHRSRVVFRNLPPAFVLTWKR